MKKAIKLMVSAVLAATMLVGCGSTGSDENTNGEASTESSASSSSGSDDVITMSGSTSMEKLCNTLKEEYMNKTGVEIDVQFTGSGAGIQAVTDGTVDIGNSSRALKDEEKSGGLAENIVALDGIGIIVDKANTVTDITKDDLAKIYKGEIKNWSELGGSDSAIIVIGREASSGTRGAFEEILGIEDQCQYAQEINSTGAVMAKVASTPGAVGYVSLDVIDDTVSTLKVDGVEATAENIKNGTYTVQRPFVMATKGEISEQRQPVQDFFNWLDSEEGQNIITKVGLVTTK
ncbi:MAG: phosphate ABC transporter substrate-binding protein [Clostridia bacterium]|nr:phosphate ABC transporter substrate-binding protein [Clostridia bacterium]